MNWTYADLVVDPRPELPDSPLWTRLLRKTVLLEDKSIAEKLLRHFWTLRSAGTIIRNTHIGIRLQPILESDGGDWESEDFFNEIRRTILAPYADVIKTLLMYVVEEG
ncbi:hypothetical protein [Paenibacillus tyrfis]|uniref:hypothetical protein n=1 Tax=Paenibacillus tyrfis TaxID=1501230 RepID=UPI000B58DFF6|nr:hypothetical protein [Paenibacillus tyrfis]